MTIIDAAALRRQPVRAEAPLFAGKPGGPPNRVGRVANLADLHPPMAFCRRQRPLRSGLPALQSTHNTR